MTERMVSNFSTFAVYPSRHYRYAAETREVADAFADMELTQSRCLAVVVVDAEGNILRNESPESVPIDAFLERLLGEGE